MNTNPPVGLSTIIGWATFVVAEATTVVTAATASQQQLEGPGKWTAILGIVALAVTNGGRYLQAHALIRSGGQPEVFSGGKEGPPDAAPAPPAAPVPAAPVADGDGHA